MNIVGIIAEYNPFHKGHAYHIAEAKKTAGAEYAVVLMSPDYVQRGEPAVTDKYTRTRMALSAGADCVLEMPVSFATGASRTFAEAGVALLEKTGIVTHLCFGSECGDLSRLTAVARILADEPDDYSDCLRIQMKNGLSYPAASQIAIAHILDEEAGALTASPNNLLGLAYLRAMIHRNSPMIPCTIPRLGDYAGRELEGAFSSAGAIRRFLENAPSHAPELPLNPASPLRDAVPPECLPIYEEAYFRCMPIFANDFSAALNYRLLSLPGNDFSVFEDVSEDLSRQIARRLSALSTFTAFAETCKSRQYTRTRINRALLHILLDIRKEEVRRAQTRDYGGYLRILGFRSRFLPCLKEMKQKSPMILLTKTADADRRLDPEDFSVFQKNLFASDLYRSVASAKYGQPLKNEYTQGLIRLP